MIFTRDRKVRLGAAAVLAGVFVAGVAVGFAVEWRTHPPDPAVETSADSDRDDSPPSDWIIDRLEMEADQKATIDSVLTEYGRRMGMLQREYGPRFRALVDSANRSLMGLLTEEQRAQYDSIEAAAERRRDRNSSGRR
jgi:hypothetical protein